MRAMAATGHRSVAPTGGLTPSQAAAVCADGGTKGCSQIRDAASSRWTLPTTPAPLDARSRPSARSVSSKSATSSAAAAPHLIARSNCSAHLVGSLGSPHRSPHLIAPLSSSSLYPRRRSAGLGSPLSLHVFATRPPMQCGSCGGAALVRAGCCHALVAVHRLSVLLLL